MFRFIGRRVLHCFIIDTTLIASVCTSVQCSSPEVPGRLPALAVPDQPSAVLVNGTQLLVRRRMADGALDIPRPYTIKGVNWSPASRCTDSPQLSGEFAEWYSQDISLMKSAGINTVRTFRDFGIGSTARQILDAFYQSGIMVIMTVDRGIADMTNIDSVVQDCRNHPSILMWAIGNEWDRNHYYDTANYPDTKKAAAFTESAAQKIHSLDTNHPVASVLSDIHRGYEQPLLTLPWAPNVVSTQQIVAALCPSVDVWGVNIYRGATLGGLFGEWRQISSKPIFLAEFGVDSFDHRIGATGAENQLLQAEIDESLWREIYLHLSAVDTTQPAIGGLVFEWNDEWWKNGRPCDHDVSTEANPGQPDGINDEEWFGLLTVDREKKPALGRMQSNFSSTASVTAAATVLLKATSSSFSQFFKESAGFCYRKGGGEAGRGINIAVINPSNGAIEDCRNFDTWANQQAFVDMSQYVTNVAADRIILAAISDDGGFMDYSSGCNTRRADDRIETAYSLLESLGSTKIRSVGYWGSWAMIAIKGQQKPLAEAYHDPEYAPLINGFCQLKNRISTEITATTSIHSVLPAKQVFFPLVAKSP